MNALTQIVEDRAEYSFAEMAREALEASDGITSLATDRLAEKVLADRSLLEVNLTEIVRAWANLQVHSAMRNLGRQPAVRLVPPASAKIDGGMFIAAVNANYERFMSRPLWGGKAIGKATAAEIYESADRYDKQAQTMTREAEWQAAVAAAVEKNGDGPQCRASDCLSEATLLQLWESVGGN